MLDTIVLIKVSLNLVRGTKVIVWKPNFLQTIDPCNTITNKKLYVLSAKHIPLVTWQIRKAHTCYKSSLLSCWPNIKSLCSVVLEKCVTKNFKFIQNTMYWKIQSIGKQEVGIWQFRKVLTRYNSLLANCWPNMKPFCLVVIETIVTKIFVGRTDGQGECNIPPLLPLLQWSEWGYNYLRLYKLFGNVWKGHSTSVHNLIVDGVLQQRLRQRLT